MARRKNEELFDVEWSDGEYNRQNTGLTESEAIDFIASLPHNEADTAILIKR